MYAYISKAVYFLKVLGQKFCMHFLFTPCVVLLQPILPSLIWPPSWYLVKGTNYETHHYARFQVLTASSMKFRVFWYVLPCEIIVDRRFRGACCLHHQGDDRNSETSVDNYFTRQYIPEGSELHHYVFFSFSQCFLPLRFKYSLQHCFLRHSQPIYVVTDLS
jgi:hypothetical protein